MIFDILIFTFLRRYMLCSQSVCPGRLVWWWQSDRSKSHTRSVQRYKVIRGSKLYFKRNFPTLVVRILDVGHNIANSITLMVKGGQCSGGQSGVLDEILLKT